MTSISNLTLKAFVLSEHKSTQRLRWVQLLGLVGAAPAAVLLLFVIVVAVIVLVLTMISSCSARNSLLQARKCREEPQYPMRCVFVHPSIKSLELQTSNCCIMLAQIHEPKTVDMLTWILRPMRLQSIDGMVV